MTLAQLIEQKRGGFVPLFQPALTVDNTIEIELSSIGGIEAADASDFDAEIFRRIDRAGALAGIGGYLERRSVYRNTDLFQGDAERCIHIGVDVFLPADTPVFAPLAGEVQSFANRQVDGDYGPLVVLRHRIDGFEFHTLYGHLSEDSLAGLREGAMFAAGARLGAIGPRPCNGNWTPHLHFQLIRDMQGNHGDYPGVVRPRELDFYRENCPDPTILLLS